MGKKGETRPAIPNKLYDKIMDKVPGRGFNAKLKKLYGYFVGGNK